MRLGNECLDVVRRCVGVDVVDYIDTLESIAHICVGAEDGLSGRKYKSNCTGLNACRGSMKQTKQKWPACEVALPYLTNRLHPIANATETQVQRPSIRTEGSFGLCELYQAARAHRSLVSRRKNAILEWRGLSKVSYDNRHDWTMRPRLKSCIRLGCHLFDSGARHLSVTASKYFSNFFRRS